MIVTFFGHSDFKENDEFEKIILDLLEEKIGDNVAEIYLGGYGNFDAFAYKCCKKYKQNHLNVSLVFVTPYLNFENSNLMYDYVIYPEIEDKPLRFAITYRNRYMVEKADLVIAYVEHDWGGAYATYKHAKRKGKEIFNLANSDL
jgi:uncharacterized phage-like protein YoqJ